MTTSDQKKIAVIGSGLIGRSWAMLFAAADFQVSLYDLEPGQLEGGMHDIQIQLGNLQSQGLLRGNLTLEQQVANIHLATDLAQCVTAAIYVQECVPERLEIKKGVYQLIDNLLGDTCILASSASALLPSKLAADLKHKNRFIVAHPTNPPFYAPLVELVPSTWTDPDVVPTTKALMELIGQVPVVLKKEISGFVLNRIQFAIIREAWWLIKDGVIDVAGLDKVMSEGLGRRYAFVGPLQTAYLNADGMYSYSERYADISEDVMSTFKGHERLEGPTLDDIQRRSPFLWIRCKVVVDGGIDGSLLWLTSNRRWTRKMRPHRNDGENILASYCNTTTQLFKVRFNCKTHSKILRLGPKSLLIKGFKGY